MTNSSEDNPIIFGTLHEDGSFTDSKIIKQQDILACPHVIMMPEHYRDDGSCKCDDPVEQQRMIHEWGYTANDFQT